MISERLKRFCEELSLTGPRKSKKILKARGFHMIGEGCFKRVYTKKHHKFVLKYIFDESDTLKLPRKNSILNKYFLPYLFVSKNRKVCVQQKVKILKTFSAPKTPDFMKMLRYDTHGYNIGKIKNQYFVIDF